MRRHIVSHSHPQAIEMTSGSIWKNMLIFSLPLILAQVLQVLFNLSDVAVAGEFAGYKALVNVAAGVAVHRISAGHGQRRERVRRAPPGRGR